MPPLVEGSWSTGQPRDHRPLCPLATPAADERYVVVSHGTFLRSKQTVTVAINFLPSWSAEPARLRPLRHPPEDVVGSRGAR